MAIEQPERGWLPPERTPPTRGTLATTAGMRTVRDGHPQAAAATRTPPAAACRSLSQPVPDHGNDRHVSRGTPEARTTTPRPRPVFDTRPPSFGEARGPGRGDRFRGPTARVGTIAPMRALRYGAAAKPSVRRDRCQTSV